MNRSDRFWINFGKSIAWGMVLAVTIAVIEVIDPVDTVQFPWVEDFGVKNFFSLLGICTFLFGLLGVAIGAVAVANDEGSTSEV